MAVTMIEAIKKMALGGSDAKSLFHGMTETQIKENLACSTVVKTVVNSNVTLHPLPLSQQAFGIWG